jgi:hypothetical protein
MESAERPGPEIECLRGVLSPMLLQSAMARAAELGIGADQVLLRWGVIDEESYIQSLAASAGLEVEDFRYLSRKDCLLADHQLHRAAESGMLYIQDGGRQVLVVAPRGLAARRLMQSRLTRGSTASSRSTPTRFWRNARATASRRPTRNCPPRRGT